MDVAVLGRRALRPRLNLRCGQRFFQCAADMPNSATSAELAERLPQGICSSVTRSCNSSLQLSSVKVLGSPYKLATTEKFQISLIIEPPWNDNVCYRVRGRHENITQGSDGCGPACRLLWLR